MKKKSYLTVTDQFCGAGGSSTGAQAAGVEIRLALNHWKRAIETHNTNFPDALHDCADVSQTDPRRYPSTDILITSPECTNHSVAKGVRRRSAQLSLLSSGKLDPAAVRSRATMWDVPRFAEFHDYRMIVVENVVDARKWRLWDSWIHAMNLLGYDYEVVYFNSMFAHLNPTSVSSLSDVVPQSRDRMYVVFWKNGNKAPDLDFRPTAFCPACAKDVGAVQSWKKKAGERYAKWGRYGRTGQYLYRCPECSNVVNPYHFAAANAIDWTLPAERIGDRKRPLKERTLSRIEAGLAKFGNQHLMIELGHTHAKNNRSASLLDPLFTQTTAQTVAVASPFYVGYANGDGPPHPVTDSLLTIHTENSHGLALPMILDTLYTSGKKEARQVSDTLPTQTARQSLGLAYMVPLRNNNNPESITEPLATFAANGLHHGLLLGNSFLMSYYGANGNYRDTSKPLGTFTAGDRHAVVTDADSVKVEDCRFRMLQPHEIGLGMAFPDNYIVLGNKREQVRQYGNAVTPPVMRRLVERCVATFN